MSDPTLVILAAGIGRRFGGDKQWAAVGPGGESLLDYAVADAAAAGFRRALLVLRPDLDPRVAADLLQRLARRIGRAEAVYQRLDDLPPGQQPPAGRAKPWGTGQALLACRHAIGAPFAMVNADDYYGPASFALAREALAGVDDATCTLVAFQLDHSLSEQGRVSRGICRLDGRGALADLVERQGIGRDAAGRITAEDGLMPEVLEPASLVSMNLWAFPPAVFGWLTEAFGPFMAGLRDPLNDEFLLTDVLGTRIRGGRLRARVLRSPETWLGLTNAADLAGVRERLAALRPTRLDEPGSGAA